MNFFCAEILYIYTDHMFCHLYAHIIKLHLLVLF